MQNNAWDEFFGNPLISSYLEEAELFEEEMPEESGDAGDTGDTGGSLSEEEIAKLAEDLKAGHITQDDIVNMYKSGKVSQEDVQKIISLVEGGEPGEAGPEGEVEGQQPTQEELLAQQIEQTNDLFIKFALYDKIIELTEKLDYFRDNFDDLKSDLYQQTLQLREFLNILSNLVFNIETPVAYQMYGSLLLRLTELFKEYNQTVKPQKDREDLVQDIQREAIDSGDVPTSPEEQWADSNKSNLVSDEWK